MSEEQKEEITSHEEENDSTSTNGAAAPAEVDLGTPDDITAGSEEAAGVSVAPVELADESDAENSSVPAPIPEVSGEGEAVPEEKSRRPRRNRRRSNKDDENEANLVALAEEQEIEIDKIDNHAIWVIKRLHAKGYKAYLAGGCVRDLLLARTPKDFDVATSATPQEVKSIFRNCRLVGRRFLLAHVFFPGGKVIETATFRANPLDEMDEEPEDLLLKRDNVFGDEEKDAYRRDLTINGLFYDPVIGKVIDHVDARADLDAKLVRTIGDPFVRFQEDPVRIVRAIKFATRLGFEIEENTMMAMRAHAADLEKCAPARLLEEFFRLLQSGYAAQAFQLCADLGVLEALMPEYANVMNHQLDDAVIAREELLIAPFANDDSRNSDEEEEASEEDVEAVVSEAAEAAERDDGDDEDFDADDPTIEIEEGMMVVSLAEEGVIESSGEGDEEDDDEEDDVDGEQVEAVAEAVEDDSETDPETEAAVAQSEENQEDAKTSEDDEVRPTPPPFRSPQERKERLIRLMTAIDQVKERGADVPSEVALAAFILPAWEALATQDLNAVQWWDKISYVWGRRLRMTRRDRERVSILLPALTRMQPQFRFGKDARQLTRRSWFRDLLLLQIVSMQAEGQDLSDIGAWKVIAEEQGRDFTQYREGERPRFRRSRRRRPPGNRGRGGRRQGGNRRRRA